MQATGTALTRLKNGLLKMDLEDKDEARTLIQFSIAFDFAFDLKGDALISVDCEPYHSYSGRSIILSWN